MRPFVTGSSISLCSRRAILVGDEPEADGPDFTHKFADEGLQPRNWLVRFILCQFFHATALRRAERWRGAKNGDTPAPARGVTESSAEETAIRG